LKCEIIGVITPDTTWLTSVHLTPRSCLNHASLNEGRSPTS